jgi:hypothetical protein
MVATVGAMMVSVVAACRPAAAEQTPADAAPADTAPADTAPADTAPADAAPADGAPGFPTTAAPPSATGPAPDGSFTVKPYGILHLAASYVLGNSSNNPDLPQWAVRGPGALYLLARQTRFGLRGSWDAPPSALHVQKASWLIESDFYGGFAGQGVGYFYPIPRLRLATATLEWTSIRFSFGQDWALLAPLIPDAAFHLAVPGFTASGNLWARLPQLRLDGVVGFAGTPGKPTWRLFWAAAIVASVQADAIPTAQSGFATVRIPQGGERSLLPAGEARVAVAHDLFDRSLEIGVSGHLGDRKIAFVGGTTRRGNGAVALDVTLPLPGKLAAKGELFWGKGLDAFFGGIGQGIAHTTDAAGNITSIGDSIAAFGGWGQASWLALEWLTLYAGAGADHPSSDDLLDVNAIMNRTLNVSFYGAVATELARGIAFWLEYDFLHTDFQAAPAVQTHVLSVTGKLTF